ncbi:hypothetical protein DKL61_10450 [Gammaproteobacteria bacterium ESL0073]|uniref:Bbp19-like phage domain-containing protein n=1 Tax=Entomomonas moraniae TaxID=2213226 RepID=A0A3S9XBE1_9GAMM|nr:hypothetical protein [Entomomonas moraniae]AWM80733.1 hypothetical protein DKL61_10450 [Gammaproteobacteria bacterium ESL0073]AZS49618.1 hypothetical protein DM558_01970 [Entomomonas moraniae]
MKQKPNEFDYQRLFEQTAGGEAILDDLITRFSLPPSFDEHNAEIKTYYRAGQRSVIDFILSRINRANGAVDHAE